MGLVNEACDNVNTKGIFSQESIDRWRAASADPNGLNEYGVPNYVAYPNTDWFDEVFDTGYSQEHNLSVSGSSEKVKYMLSLGYLDNQGSHEPPEPRLKYAENQFPYQPGSQDSEMDDRRHPSLRTKARLRDG